MGSLKPLLKTFTPLLVCLLTSLVDAQVFQSPCPQLFTYDTTTNETDRWYGTLTLLSESDLLDIWLRLTFDQTSIQLGNWFGQVETSDSKEYHIRKSNFELKSNVPQKFRFFLKYNPSLPAPRLLSFRLNGKLVCPGDSLSNPLDASSLDRGTGQTNIQNTFGTNFQNGVGTNSQDRSNTNSQNFDGGVNSQSGSGVQDRLGVNSREKVNSQTNRNSNDRDDTQTNNPSNRINSQQQPSTQQGSNNRNRVTTQPGINTQAGASSNSRETVSTRPSISSQDRVNSQFVANSLNVLGTNDQDRVNNHIDTNSPDRVNTRPSTNFQDNTNTRDRLNTQSSTNPRDRVNTTFQDKIDTNTRDRPNTQSSTNARDRINSQTNTNPQDRLNTQLTSTSSSRDSSNTNFQESPITATRYNVPRDNICGTVLPQPRPLIAYAEVTHEGEFPWHSALYVAKQIRLTYICGASLISTSYVITTAHCLMKKKPQESLRPEEIIVQLGKYNLKRFSIGYQDRSVSKIIAHPQFETDTYRNDIALLKLATPANITEYVRPVCLWQESTDVSSVLNKIGKVVGWGYDETGKVTEELMQANMPVVPRDKCISSYPDFYTRFTSVTTYCAGFANGTSPCNGDAGGGMVFPIPNSRWNNPVWQLRGLVSILPTFQNQMLCDVTHYTIFVDVAKFLDWIIATMN